MSKFNIGYYLEVLFQIDKELGGRQKLEKGAKAGDEFTILQEGLKEKFYEIKSKIIQKNEKQEQNMGQRNHEIIKLEMSIKEQFADCNRMLDKMAEVIKKLAAKNADDFIYKEKLYNNLKKQLQNLKDFNEGIDSMTEKNTELESITELSSKKMLLEGSSYNKNMNRHATEEEKQAIEQYKMRDREMDDRIQEINQGVLTLKTKVDYMTNAIETTEQQIDKLSVEFDKVNTELQTQNQSLKNLIIKNRSPSRFCCDIALVVVLGGLIFFIWQLLK